MHRILAAFMAIAALLVLSLYWLWQIATGRPALDMWSFSLRAFVTMGVTYVLGWFVGRLGVSVISEAWQEALARRRDRAMAKAIAAEESGLGGEASGEAESREGA